MSHTWKQLHASVSKPPSTETAQSDMLISSPSTPRSRFALVLSVHLSCHTLFHILISLRREKQCKDRACFTFCLHRDWACLQSLLPDMSELSPAIQPKLEQSHPSSYSLTFFWNWGYKGSFGQIQIHRAATSVFPVSPICKSCFEDMKRGMKQNIRHISPVSSFFFLCVCV